MPPVISSVLTSKKPLDAHEWLADIGARDEFYQELKSYLIRAIAQQIEQPVGHVKHHLELYWSKSLDLAKDDYAWMFAGEPTAEEQEYADHDDLLDVIKKTVITIEGVHFPAIEWTDPQQDYPQLFSLINTLNFIDCEFYDQKIFTAQLDSYDSLNMYFTGCVFHNDWNAIDGSVTDAHLPFFDKCEFKAKVLISGRISSSFSNSHHLCIFKDCSLNQVVIKNSRIDIRLFEFSKDKDAVLKALKIKKSTFNAKLSLSYIKTIESLEFSSTIFNKKFALTNCECNKLLIKNTNFKGLADFYSSQFAQFQLRKSIFSDFVGFEKCQFGIKQAAKMEAVTLNYVTFYSFINFRDAVFNQPLDLRNTNRKEQPNFLDAHFSDIAAESTDRETFRIIKHSFDAVGNHIEANKYFAHEMQAYRRELKKEATEGRGRHWRERFLLGVNAVASKHGQNYLCASAWFFAVIGVIALVMANDKYKWCIASAPIQRGLYFVGDALNDFALGFLPLGAVFEGKEHLAFFLFFATLALSGITWHLLVAIRRHSKR